MMTDEEILAEERLSDEQEVVLYNIALRQDDMRTQSTDMLLSQLDSSPFYQEMIEREFLTYTTNGGGASSVVANLRVTAKGLRYCVLRSEEIEPKRAHDVAGVLRKRPAQNEAEGQGDSGRTEDPIFYPAIEASAYSERNNGILLTEKQSGYITQTELWRKEVKHRKRTIDYGEISEKREWAAEDGSVWSYAVLDDTLIQIEGVKGSQKALHVPESIEGMPVVSIAAAALARDDTVEEIVCSDDIVSIGTGAFRNDPRLKKLVLPAQMADFDASWIAQCPNLQEMTLPGMLETIKRGVLASDNLKMLTLGKSAREVEPGAFQGSKLERIVVNEENPFMATDGIALYSADHKVLMALSCPTATLAVDDRCEMIGEKCCHGFTELEELSLPDTVTEIGAFAFSSTGLKRFVAPSSLKRLDDKAFFYCGQLTEAVLNDGLEWIGDSVFQGSALESIVIPATVEHIGASVTRGTKVVHSGPNCTFSIDARSKDHFYDGEGGLYRIEEDGAHLVQLIDADKELYNVYEGAVAIDPSAFAFHDHIAHVRVPDSVRTIGESAFRVCKNLTHVSLPDTLEAIGEEAFFDTNLEEIRIPAALKELGERALVSEGAHYGRRLPSIGKVEVSPENETFYLASGMLCRRTGEGDSVVLFTGSESEVVFPDQIVKIEDFAFSNARGIEYLSLNPGIRIIGSNGLSTNCWIEHIHIELANPLEGRSVFDFHFPNTQGGIRGISLGLGGANWVHIPGIVEQLDVCLANAHSYIKRNEGDDISAYEQTRLILDRFDDPFLLTNANRTTLERVLRNNIVEISVDVALHDDRSTFDELVERGYVTPENLDEIIERVTALRDAATSAHLLETKRTMFAQSAFDYDL